MFLVSLLYFSDSLLICSARFLTDSFGWLAVILSAAISTVPVFFWGRFIADRNIALPFYYASKAVSVILIAVSVILFNNFISTCVNMDIAQWIIPVFILLVAAFASSGSFAAIKRSSVLLFAIIAVFMLLASVLIANRADFANIRHLWQGRQPFLVQMIVYIAIFVLKGTVLCVVLRAESLRSDTRVTVSAISIASGLLASGILIGAIQLASVTVLGDNLYSLVDYPVYHTLGLTRWGDYFERTEVISLAIFMITLTFKTSVLMRLIFCKRKEIQPGGKT